MKNSIVFRLFFTGVPAMKDPSHAPENAPEKGIYSVLLHTRSKKSPERISLKAVFHILWISSVRVFDREHKFAGADLLARNPRNTRADSDRAVDRGDLARELQ